jgi:hypothetical protein
MSGEAVHKLERELRDSGVWATVYENNGSICLRLDPIDADKLRTRLASVNENDRRLAR